VFYTGVLKGGYFMLKRVNDLIALLTLTLILPGLWILNGRGIIQLTGEVIGATIAAFTLIIQYYFRKKPSGTDGGSNSG
jgi:hypothetical protein